MRLPGWVESPAVRNEFSGGSAEYVVMTGSVQGGIHVHLHPREAAGRTRWRGLLLPLALVVAALTLLVRVDVTMARVTGVLLLVGALWRGFVALRGAKAGDVFLPDTRLDAAQSALASGLRAVYDREERLSRIHDPVPLRVRWAGGDPLLADHWINIRDGEGEPLDLTGELADVAAEFEGLPMRRLVVLGAAGAGKSVLALRLARTLLDRGRDPDPDPDSGASRRAAPVPVVLPLAAWDAARSGPWEWAARQLAALHPTIAATDLERHLLARALLDTGRVLPVLDGFDELPDGARATALDRLNAGLGPGRGLVLTSRPEAYAKAVDSSDVLTGAAVVELQPLTVEQLAEFLPRTTRPTGRGDTTVTKWDPVLRRLGDTTGGDVQAKRLRAALSTPLMVGLARAAYSDTDADPMDLLDADRFPDQRAVQRHLLDAYVPAVYRIPLDDRAARGPWNGEQAGLWLGFLARHSRADGIQALAWWRLHLATWGVIGAVPSVLAAGALSAALYWTGAGRGVADTPWVGGPMWLDLGSLAAVAALLWWATQQRTKLPGPRKLASPRAWRPWQPVESLTNPADTRVVPGPRTVLRDDRKAALTAGGLWFFQGHSRAWAQLAALGAMIVVGMVWWARAGRLRGYPAAPTDVLLFIGGCVVAVILYGWGTTAWVRYTQARVWLALRGRLPWRLQGFLEDAHRRGVLRQSGGVYQFRHLELRDRLAGEENEEERRDFAPRPAVRVAGSVGQIVLAVLLVGTALVPRVWSPPPGPYASPHDVCALLTKAWLRPLMSRPQMDRPSADQCRWAESGPGRDAELRLGVAAAEPEQGYAGAIVADSWLGSAGSRRSAPLPGVGDRAMQQVQGAAGTLYGDRAFVEDGRRAVVRARVGNLYVELSYQEELADAGRVLTLAVALTREVLHNAAGTPPPAGSLADVPTPTIPDDSRFARHRTVTTASAVLGGETWGPGERSELHDLPGFPFVFRGPRLLCGEPTESGVLLCQPAEGPGDPGYAGLRAVIERCGSTPCSKKRADRLSRPSEWYLESPSDFQRLDGATRYNDVEFGVEPLDGWPDVHRLYAAQLLRHIKADGVYYLLALQIYTEVDQAALARKTLNDVLAQSVPAAP
ncbi:hypothetical protein SGFS_029800 [Streptomyces graminofaciens]|uniref:NACHT domain-containing protein n=1 Tax=Streptomyces graminofaciens TaxID=68212 RepID=A0ABM7F6Z1_9ACTN|nr:NACHT domain-containing protein [Streptomyces graminofaciens]BBC31686.1 hypothetical protein SGFS_029800 [Streptomyces graminofaciens]